LAHSGHNGRIRNGGESDELEFEGKQMMGRDIWDEEERRGDERGREGRGGARKKKRWREERLEVIERAV